MITSSSDRDEPQPVDRPRGDGSGPELAAMALAACGWFGAAVADSAFAPRWVLVVVALMVVAAKRRPLLLAAPVFLLTSHLAARADENHVPMRAGPVDVLAEVLSDPEPVTGGWLIEVRLPDGDRVQARAYGRDGVVATRTVVGSTVRVAGSVKPVVDSPWLRSRHITGSVAVDELELVDGPSLVHRIPELLRARVAAGASGMSERQRALYLGLVIGDDRLQPLGQQLRFRAAGLTHLLAVSGQNVAFALAVARPLLQLLGYRGRFVGVVAVLALFALMTRLEPSVLRATATAAIAAWAGLSGRERTGLTVLSVAVTALICIDPFLVDAIGFQLSVAASVGILVLGPVVERRLVGPAWLQAPLALTLSAQLGVSPLLTAYFGPMSLASVPANLLAGWAAAAIMTIGLSVGVIAGAMPDAIGHVVQFPAEALLWWIEGVATYFAQLPAPRLGAGSLMMAGAALVLVKLAGDWPLRLVPLGLLAAIGIVAVPRPPAAVMECGPAMTWYPGDGRSASAIVMTGAARDRSLEDCLDAGISAADVLIIERGNASAARLVTAATEVLSVGVVMAPPQHRVIGARRQLEDRRIATATGVLLVRPTADGRRLEVSFDRGEP